MINAGFFFPTKIVLVWDLNLKINQIPFCLELKQHGMVERNLVYSFMVDLKALGLVHLVKNGLL